MPVLRLIRIYILRAEYVLSLRCFYIAFLVTERVSQPLATVKPCAVKTKFHYASWFEAGSELVRSWFELKFGLAFSLLAAN